MNKSFSVFFVIVAFLFIHAGGHCDDRPFNKRDFRAIEPVKKTAVRHVEIKQNVKGGSTQRKEQTLKVTIPPPPVPGPEASLFPDAPEFTTGVDLPPESFSDTIDVSDLPPLSDDDTDSADSETDPLDSETSDSLLTLSNLREEAHQLAQDGLRYSFGAANPDSGGLDCSGVVQHLLKKLGVEDVPRTSYDQYYWLKKKKLLDDVHGKSASKKLFKKLSPGDLIFWGGTWNSGHKVSHVMIYMGYDEGADKHYIFGARGKKSSGMFGNGVDIFELDPDRGRLIAHGKIPGLVYD